MQVRNYSRKISIPATEIIEVLQSSFTKTRWTLTSELKDSHISLLDQTFGIDNLQPKLPASKEQLQLSGSNSNLDRVQPTGELVDHLQENATNLTTADVDELQATIRTSIIEETAELAAIRDFQTYQATYDTTKRTLVVNDIYQKLDERNKARKKFEEEQKQLANDNTSAKSSDLLSEMLGILKADKYKSDFLTSKLEQI